MVMVWVCCCISGSVSCAVPRRLKKSKRTRRLRHLTLSAPPSLPYPKPSPTPLLPLHPVSSSSPSSPRQFLDTAIAHLESSSLHLSPDPALLLSILRHVTLPTHLTRLRRLIPLFLLRRHASLFAQLVHLYCRHGLVRDAHHLFDQMPHRHKSSVFIWNCLISGYAEFGFYHDALALYHQMEEDGIPPDRFTFPRVLKACAGLRLLPLGQNIHRHVVRSGFGNDLYSLNALVDMYAKCGHIQAARKVFDVISERDLISWNSMLVAYSRHGLWREVAWVLRCMLDAGFKPDSISISNLISGFSQSSSTKLGLAMHAWAIRHALIGNLSVGNSLIGFYSKINKLALARKVFESMAKKDVYTWNAIISAHRLDRQIFDLFERMIQSGIKPDKVTFISLLSSCADLGLVVDGKRLFDEMQGKYNVRPDKEHYGCMVNMLGKAGRIKEAYDIIRSMHSISAAGPAAWGSLLYACSVHVDVEVGEVAAEKLFSLEPDNKHNFELMKRVYRKAGRVDGVERIERMMLDRGFEL
ncbi:Pentatricopeptide repeat-containing protein [Rhynchospora pubera]|uniref:Pentatricopeptide repeat-containing protein n=1 Tax=Rhynchospora pubera TaxID=906938 RepID=A0AAV8GQX7_9POAL|nr:Pentatricopeptide repeat-containing protein [Rhynchospora pubera]